MEFYEPKEWPVGARSGQLDMTFVAFSIVPLRIGDLHQGHVRQCEAGARIPLRETAPPSCQGGWVAGDPLPKRDLQAGHCGLFEMNAEKVEGTTQTKCCEGECSERELEEPPVWWIPATYRSSVFFNPLLLAIDYPTALHVLDRYLRLQGLSDRPQSALIAISEPHKAKWLPSPGNRSQQFC